MTIMKCRIILAMLIVSAGLFQCQPGGRSSGASPLDTLDNGLILAVNNLTYTIADEHDHFYSFIGVRAFAMVHLAIHDLLNAIDPKYEPYHFKKKISGVDPAAAIVSSTRRLLLKAFPERADTIDQVCDEWLAHIPERREKMAGIAFGEEVADDYIRLRNHDGHEKRGNYTPMTKPGDYRYTPGFDWVLIPDFSAARPFTLDSVSQFRSPPPPSLSSNAYLTAYNEVKAYGKIKSEVRSEDQSNYAHWWAEFGEHSWNRIGRITARKKNLPAVETNRMFALLNMNLYDFYIVSLESKYFYDTWRPYTAIRQGDHDTNPKTIGDTSWEPEMLTPPWPEYPSAHAGVGAAGAEIVAAIFGTPDVSFTMESSSALPGARQRNYTNLDQAANDCADSRIMNGYHFRFSTEEGKRQGRLVARHTLIRYLRKR
jgi:hypothetical protein